MYVFWLAFAVSAFGGSSTERSPRFWGSDDNVTSIMCQEFGNVENGQVTISLGEFVEIANVTCNRGFDLEGAKQIFCIDGKWNYSSHPRCSRRCLPPPYVKNGSLEIEGEKDAQGLFGKGTLATYSCRDNFRLVPEESQYRVCERGVWTGPVAMCEAVEKITQCSEPPSIANGYFVQEKSGEFEPFAIGQRLHYSCKEGFDLIGSAVQQCIEDGSWSPKIPPECLFKITADISDDRTGLIIGGSTSNNNDDYGCSVSPSVAHSYTTVVHGYQSESGAAAGTVVQIHCTAKYRNSRAPCQPGKLRCNRGTWIGVTPDCVPARDCEPPPAVSYAVIYNLNPTSYETSFTNRYPLKSQISYQCLPGYTMQGNDMFTCSMGGCWAPEIPPTCYRSSSNNYFLEVNSFNAVLISTATGAGVLGLLLVICLITVCRRRKPSSARAVPIAPPIQNLGDHATLMHHPDRLALIAFADGMQNEQASLPTYDEATRERNPGLPSGRLHRPHWPSLAGRRSRNGPDMVHVTRHGSFASHTPSTRSGADSMGSTDTVAVSEGSTNVTLDTASSHSGSQAASCRVHCGSLASFDTSSVVNTEGVPLLEESELEELQGGDNISLMADNPSISDNASFKLSTHSAEIS